MGDYKRRLVEVYFSSHYQRFFPRNPREYKWVIDRIDWNFRETFELLPRDASILDVACGVGYLEYYLLKRGFTKIHAIDLSREQIEVAQKILKDSGINFEGKAEFQLIDVFEFLKKSKDYDVIAIIDFIEHITKQKAFELLELSREALKQSGLLIIRTTNASNPLFSQAFYRDFTHETAFSVDSIVQCLNAAGFRDIKITYEKAPLFPIQKWWVINGIRSLLYSLKLKFLGKLFGVHPDAFSEDLIAIARK